MQRACGRSLRGRGRRKVDNGRFLRKKAYRAGKGQVMGEFSVGKFAKIIGVNAQTLRYYETLGILKPERDAENGYRRYTDLDVRRVLYCRLYRALGFSLDEIQEYFQFSDLKTIGQKIRQKSQELQRQAEELLSLKEQVDYFAQQIEQIEKAPGECWIQTEGEDFYRLSGTRQNDLIERKEKEQAVETLQNMVPFTRMTVRIRRESLRSENGLIFDWGLGILARQVRGKPVEAELRRFGEYHRTAPMAVTIVRSLQKELTANELEPLLSYMEERGYRLAGDLIGVLLLPEFEEEIVHYIKLFAPIEQ